MTRYQCLNPECKKTFLYSARLTIQNILTSSEHNRILETYVCPYCQGLDIDEVKAAEQKITSVLSVPLEEVDAKLKEGYLVHELYARSATLVKKEA